MKIRCSRLRLWWWCCCAAGARGVSWSRRRRPCAPRLHPRARGAAGAQAGAWLSLLCVRVFPSSAVCLREWQCATVAPAQFSAGASARRKRFFRRRGRDKKARLSANQKQHEDTHTHTDFHHHAITRANQHPSNQQQAAAARVRRKQSISFFSPPVTRPARAQTGANRPSTPARSIQRVGSIPTRP